VFLPFMSSSFYGQYASLLTIIAHLIQVCNTVGASHGAHS